MKHAYDRLRLLDERLTYKVRGASSSGFSRPGVDQLEIHVRALAEYTIELRSIVEELFVAIGSRPQAPATPGG